MRLATIHTPHGPRAAAQVGDGYVDLHATDPGLPTCMKRLLAASPAVRKAAAEAAAVAERGEVRGQRGEAAAAGAGPRQDPLHRAELPRPRDRGRQGRSRPSRCCSASSRTRSSPTATRSSCRRSPRRSITRPSWSIVIGKTGKHIPNDKSAFEYVGGYTCGHDVSARDWQFRGEEKQWIIGKTFDTFAPTGPVLVTADELTDPHKLQVQLRLNGTDDAELEHEGVHLRRAAPAVVPVAGGDAGAGRPDLHRHAAGRRASPASRRCC